VGFELKLILHHVQKFSCKFKQLWHSGSWEHFKKGFPYCGFTRPPGAMTMWNLILHHITLNRKLLHVNFSGHTDACSESWEDYWTFHLYMYIKTMYCTNRLPIVAPPETLNCKKDNIIVFTLPLQLMSVFFMLRLQATIVVARTLNITVLLSSPVPTYPVSPVVTTVADYIDCR
jgi:hypothetical protein